MLKMGFHVKWINLMMSCVHSVSYSIIINGKPRGHMMSCVHSVSYFICAEGLSALLTKFVEDGLLKGVVACLRGPTISHLFFFFFFFFFFVDDSLFFAEP